MANLAIKGHATRGEEVIEILEMLGGKNCFYYDGTFKELIYTINSALELDVFNINSTSVKDGYIVFTLEEFLKKFPYKVGDKVTLDGWPCTIVNMDWDIYRILYTVKGIDFCKCVYVEDLQPYKEQETMNIPETMKQITGIAENLIKIDIPKGYEFAGVDDDKHQAIFERIKPKYPKTHNECCDVLGLPYMQLGVVGYKCETLHHLQQLLLYRDAYWKVAGDWRPNVEDEKQDKYAISNVGGKLSPEYYGSYNSILCFPTREVRDIFFETFKEEIEKCKDLL